MVPGQNVDEDLSGMDALTQSFETSCLDRRKPVAQHRGKDLDHLPVAVGIPRKLATDTLQSGRQNPVLERSAVP